jgi:hypothetical protein
MDVVKLAALALLFGLAAGSSGAAARKSGCPDGGCITGAHRVACPVDPCDASTAAAVPVTAEPTAACTGPNCRTGMV